MYSNYDSLYMFVGWAIWMIRYEWYVIEDLANICDVQSGQGVKNDSENARSYTTTDSAWDIIRDIKIFEQFK